MHTFKYYISELFDRPTSTELVEAVAIFLEEKIKDNLPNHLAFNTQIAINILNIVKRELEQEDKLSEDSKEILINLIGDSEKANIKHLAESISSGKVELDNKELQEALVEITKKKLSVDNPRYSTYKKLFK